MDMSIHKQEEFRFAWRYGIKPELSHSVQSNHTKVRMLCLKLSITKNDDTIIMSLILINFLNVFFKEEKVPKVRTKETPR